MWILFLVFVTSTGNVNSSTVYFADKPACDAAMQAISQQITGMQIPVDIKFYLQCQPMSSVGRTSTDLR